MVVGLSSKSIGEARKLGRQSVDPTHNAYPSGVVIARVRL